MTQDIAKIRALNDRCRQGLDRNARIIVTRACLAAFTTGEGTANQIIAQAKLMAAVRRYRFAEAEMDEHDRGEIVIDGTAVRFKIDYYDFSLEWGSEDPANPEVTRRVLTIMLPEDD